MFDLRAFLRRSPQPYKLRIRTQAGQERVIELPQSKRRWADIEASVRSTGAIDVECLDKEGGIIRACSLTDEDLELDDAPPNAQAAHDEKIVTKALVAQAQMLDRYGARMNDAYERGARAASATQAELVELVRVLTENYNAAIVNMHNLAANLAQQMIETATNGGDGGGNGALVEKVIGVLAGGSLGAAMPPAGNGRKSP